MYQPPKMGSLFVYCIVVAERLKSTLANRSAGQPLSLSSSPALFCRTIITIRAISFVESFT
jgi:hypothetical protein